MKGLHLQCQHFTDLQKAKRVLRYFEMGGRCGLAAFSGINAIRSAQTLEKAAFSEPLASSCFSCRKILPVAINLAQDFWLTEFSV